MPEQLETTEHPALPTVQASDAPARVVSPEVRSGTAIGPQAGGGTCGCGAASALSFNGTGVASYVYAIGRVEARFPNLAAEKEYAQVTGRTETAGKTDHPDALSALAEIREQHLLAVEDLVAAIESGNLSSYLTGGFTCPVLSD